MTLIPLAKLDGTVRHVSRTDAIYAVAANAMDLDLAPARRRVDSFVKRRFGCEVDELDDEQYHAAALHIKAGDLKAHAGECEFDNTLGKERRDEEDRPR